TASLLLSLLLVAPPSASAATANFQDDVLPILKRHCVGCHNADESKAGLDLTSSTSALAGSSGGSVVKAGRPDSSPLYLAITRHEDYPAMPPKKPKLSDANLKTIRDWISSGLIASAEGKSQLREVAFDVRAGSRKRPEKPAFPKNLPSQPLANTTVSPPILALARSPWANLLAASGHRQVLLYGSEKDAAKGLPHVGTLPFPEGDVHDLRFSRNGELLIAAGGVGAESGKVVVFDVKTGRRVATLGDEYDVVLSADISADHKYVAIGTPAKLVKIFSTATGKLLHRIRKHTDWVTVARFSPDGTQLATADRNGGVHVWEVENAGIVYTLDEHKVKVTALSWRPDGKLLASAAEDGKFVLWDMKDGWATRSIIAHAEKARSRYSRRAGVLDIAFANDGRILTVGRDRAVRLWNMDGTRVSEANNQASLPLRARFLAGGKMIAVGAFDGRVHTFHAPKITRGATLETAPNAE
ncbi:MAG: c-type cytochrome, partial [Planctomycetales bacterium]